MKTIKKSLVVLSIGMSGFVNQIMAQEETTQEATPQKQQIKDTDIVQTQPGEWRQKDSEINGFGIGIYLSGYKLFYDYQVSEKVSLHTYYAMYDQKKTGIFWKGDYFVKTNSSYLGATLRYFPSQKYGFYYGGGTEIVTAKQKTSIPEYCSLYDKSGNSKECQGKEGNLIFIKNTSSFTGLGIYGELGWQGYDGYYFTIGLRAGKSLALSEKNNTDKVFSESSTAKKQWNEAKSPNAISILFGWRFDGPRWQWLDNMLSF